jgi:hypothetical protein
MMPMGMGPPPSAPKKSGKRGKFAFITDIYNDEFQWSLVKSSGMFLFGIYLARELRGVDITGGPQMS